MRDLILGGQDGLVNVLGIVFGVTTAGGSIHVVLAAGLAATFAEAVSMGAVSYTSTLSMRDYYLKELSQEKKEIELVPNDEREEIRAFYRRKGFEGNLLEQIVEKVTINKESWAEEMVLNEHKLEPVDTGDVLRSSIVVGISTVGGSLIPLLPFFVMEPSRAIYVSFLLSAVALFLVGFIQAKSYVGSPIKKGIQMLLIGMGAAVIGFAVGKFFNVGV